MLVKRPVRAALVRGIRRRAPASPWLAVRVLRRRGPIGLRSSHVRDEEGFGEIGAVTRPVSVRYVVQEHRTARQKGRPHWDLRIHHGGKALSWAIPKGMPPAGERVLAVRQPDHEQAYSDFEGEIPAGQYGAGTVRKDAEGTVDILKVETERGRQSMHLRFHGGIEGDYVMVRTSGRNWLLVGKRYEPLEPVDRHRYAGKPREKLAAIERECGGGCIAEVKVDGHHEIIHLTDGRGVRLASHRLGKHTGVPIEHTDKLPHLRDMNPGVVRAYGASLPDERGWIDGEGTVLHGELHVKGRSAAFTGGVLNSKTLRARQLQEREGPVQVKVFDVARVKGRSVRHLGYGARREIAMAIVRDLDDPNVHYVRGTRSGFPDFYDRVVAGKEFRYGRIPQDGVVVKRLDQPYQDGPWWKVKPHDMHDLEIVGWKEEVSRAGKPKGRLGSLTVVTPDGKRVQVGTGYTDAQKEWIWEHREEIVGDTAMVRFHRAGVGRGSSWPGPRFGGFHPGKSETGALMEIELKPDHDPKVRLYYFEGRNTGVAAYSEEEARSLKRRGGDRLVAVRKPTPKELADMQAGRWVRTRADGLPPGESRVEGPGLGPRPERGQQV